MKFFGQGVPFIVLSACVVLSACGAAVDVQSVDGPTSLALLEPTTTRATLPEQAETSTTTSTVPEPGSTSVPGAIVSAPTSAATVPGSSTTTLAAGPTTAVVDVNAPFCAAASRMLDLGTSVALDDPEAAAVFFDQQADRWAAAVLVAPFVIAADVSAVATFVDELRNLMAENDYDLFAVVDEATAMEAELGSDAARIRSVQFIYRTCEIEPEAAVDATAVFYIELLDTAEGQGRLAEILAAAEVFSLDGANCFVERTSVDAIYPLVGAASTTAQATALEDVLSECQITMGPTT